MVHSQSNNPYGPGSFQSQQRDPPPQETSAEGSSTTPRSVPQQQVFQSNRVCYCRVPSQLLKDLDPAQPSTDESHPAEPSTDELDPAQPSPDEFSMMRYTAATCDPDDFKKSQYSLRPFTQERQTKVFIVMTMYNEDEVLFIKSMDAVRSNIAYLCDEGKWGPEGWQNVVVCIVADGRKKVYEYTLEVLNLMECYRKDIVENSVRELKDVTAHIFECTSTAIVTASGEVSHGRFPVQILFCLKEQNQKKLNSHRWFFNAFAPLLEPTICVLLDVGTAPTEKSIYELWRCFIRHNNVGGACGEICVDPGRYCSTILKSPLAASQNFEYKMSNILDKPFESVFGYISVLPGAFSAYRYDAIKNDNHGIGPLASYFKGETTDVGDNGAQPLGESDANGKRPGLLGKSKTVDGKRPGLCWLWGKSKTVDGKTPGLLDRNMYLAEDRILCFELVTKKNEAWVLKYVKSAKASTDVPTTVPEFISQRRRWLNGSLFASIHATVFFYRIWTSGHSLPRKIFLQIEFIYNAIQLFFTWTAPANFYLAFFFLVGSATKDPASGNAFDLLGQGAGKDIFDIVLSIYIGVLFLILVCSLGNRPQGSKWAYSSAMFLFGFCNLIMLWCAAYTVYLTVLHKVAGWRDFSELSKKNQPLREIVISILATYGVYFVSSMMHCEPWHMFTSWIQYLFLLPSYVNILMVYAMCNLHDVSWGTKGPSADTTQTDRDRNIRTNILLMWAGSNILIIIVFTSNSFANWTAPRDVGGDITPAFSPYLSFLIYTFAGLSAARFTGSFLYLFLQFFEVHRQKWSKKIIDYIRKKYPVGPVDGVGA